MALSFNLIDYFTDFDESITISGETVTAIVSSISKAPQYTESGLEENYDLSVTCTIADFTTEPVVGETAVVRSVTYTIGRIEKDPKNITAEYYLEQRYAS